jgi:hypothetical protein
MTSEAAAAAFTMASASLRVPAGSTAVQTMDSVMAILRAFAVAKSPKHAILYARSLAGGHHFTALLKVEDEAGTSVGVVIKSAAVGHAAAVLADVTAALAEDEAAAAATKAATADE